MTAPIVKRPDDYAAFRIAEGDTNYMACIADPIGEAEAGVGFTLVVEIYDVGGKTPPNAHAAAHELFFILNGEGLAHCDGHTAPIAAGDTVILPPGTTHVIENTGAGKLYALCLMVPNEDFAEMIRGGTPVALTEHDRAVIAGAGAAAGAALA
ncbi:MAG: cupin domain-containing protein, partial [Alphaproteobacteria bacterium]|nr:cupin domain-containing protein [Alphaproteobacteria bacterium]